MVGTVQSGIANVYQNSQNITAGSGFQNQAAQSQQQQRAEQTQQAEQSNQSNIDEANLSAQRTADIETSQPSSSGRPGSIVDISV
jgi:F0F1-type ATP synthase epsilon subunit